MPNMNWGNGNGYNNGSSWSMPNMNFGNNGNGFNNGSNWNMPNMNWGNNQGSGWNMPNFDWNNNNFGNNRPNSNWSMPNFNWNNSNQPFSYGNNGFRRAPNSNFYIPAPQNNFQYRAPANPQMTQPAMPRVAPQAPTQPVQKLAPAQLKPTAELAKPVVPQVIKSEPQIIPKPSEVEGVILAPENQKK